MTELRVGLAAVELQDTIPDGVETVGETLARASERDVDVVCFPETYLPGLRSLDLGLPDPDQAANERALDRIRSHCADHGTAAVAGMEWVTDRGLENRAVVVSGDGDVLGHQTKNQITPDAEEDYYVPGEDRSLFEVAGVTFGVVVCHEGWRYPETVRWAARRGASLVFQPQWTGSPDRETSFSEWGTTLYERSMQCRAAENGVFFASVNVAMPGQNSATSLIDPGGDLVDYVPHGEERLLVADVDTDEATRLYADRYDPTRYPE